MEAQLFRRCSTKECSDLQSKISFSNDIPGNYIVRQDAFKVPEYCGNIRGLEPSNDANFGSPTTLTISELTPCKRLNKITIPGESIAKVCVVGILNPCQRFFVELDCCAARMLFNVNHFLPKDETYSAFSASSLRLNDSGPNVALRAPAMPPKAAANATETLDLIQISMFC